MQHGSGMQAGDPAFHADIPDELLALDRWIVWDVAHHNGKPTKKPRGSLLDLRNCSSYADCSAVVVGDQGGLGLNLYEGIQDRDGSRYVALDLDGCRSPTDGLITAWVHTLLEHYRWSYTEITPSGTGLRLWLKVRKPPAGLPKIFPPYDAPPGVAKSVEIQTFGLGAANYVTVTGDRQVGSGLDILTVDDLQWLMDQFGVQERTTQQAAADAVTEQEQADTWARDGARVVDALRHLPGADREDWLMALAALKDYGGEAAREPAREWSKAKDTRHVYDEVDFDRNWDSLNRTDSNRRTIASLFDRAAAAGWEFRPEPGDLSAFSDVDADAFVIPARAPDPNLPRGPEPQLDATGKPMPLLLQAGEFSADSNGDDWLIFEVLPRSGCAQVFGPPGAGKTPVALSLAHTVAGGRSKWFGHEVERHGQVVYLVGEDPHGMKRRNTAQHTAYTEDGTVEVSMDALPLHFSTQPGELCNPADADRWIVAIRKIIGPDPVALVVVDTLNANFGAGDENSTQDMTTFVANLNKMARALGCLVLVVHHPGVGVKDRARGSSVLFGALDAEYFITKAEGTMEVQAKCHKLKNADDQVTLTGQLTPRQVGTDSKGRPRTAVTLDDTYAGPPANPDVFPQHDGPDPIELLLLAIHESTDGKVSTASLQDVTGLTRRDLRDLLQDAEGGGHITVKPGKGRTPSTYEVGAGAKTTEILTKAVMAKITGESP